MDFNIDEQYKLLKRAFTMLRRKGYTGKTRTNVSNERMVDDYTQLKKHIVFNTIEKTSGLGFVLL